MQEHLIKFEAIALQSDIEGRNSVSLYAEGKERIGWLYNVNEVCGCDYFVLLYLYCCDTMRTSITFVLYCNKSLIRAKILESFLSTLHSPDYSLPTLTQKTLQADMTHQTGRSALELYFVNSTFIIIAGRRRRNTL